MMEDTENPETQESHVDDQQVPEAAPAPVEEKADEAGS